MPTSRAYWELKAEKMLNRIFDPEPVTDLVIEDHPPAGGTAPRALPPAPLVRTGALPPGAARVAAALPPLAASTGRTRRADLTLPLLGVLGGVCLVSTIGSLLLVSQWNQQQQALRQERNLLLLERLRSLGPASPTPMTTSDAAGLPLTARQRQIAAAAELPPPPPEEPWVQQLSELPSPDRSAAVLRVPVSPSLTATAPPATGTLSGPRRGPGAGSGSTAKGAPGTAASRAGGGPLPLLVGVVAAPGRASAAIFQVGGSSSSVSVGDAIPGTEWRLRAAEGDTATIERSGEQRRVSIGNGE